MVRAERGLRGAECITVQASKPRKETERRDGRKMAWMDEGRRRWWKMGIGRGLGGWRKA